MQTIVTGVDADLKDAVGDLFVYAIDSAIKIPQLTDSNGVDLTSFLVWNNYKREVL